MSGFTKLFGSIIHSTVWRTDMHVKVVWVTLLALSDRSGNVWSSMPGLADAAKVSLDQCVDAIGVLKKPDKWSRTKSHNGRRIKEIDGGWLILNYMKYRTIRNEDERREQVREAVWRHRQKKSNVIKKANVSHESQCTPNAEAEAEQIQRDQERGADQTQDQDHRADARASHRVLVKLGNVIRKEQTETEVPLSEFGAELKDRAAKAGIPYDAESIRKAVDVVIRNGQG